MKSNLILITVIISLLIVGCQVKTEASPQDTVQITTNVTMANEVKVVGNEQPQQQDPSCAQPTPEMAADCRAQEAQILAATVRLELRTQQTLDSDATRAKVERGTGHATLVGGRYLVTHNHWPLSLQDLQTDTGGHNVWLVVTNLNGDTIIPGSMLDSFDIVSKGPETLVLDFRQTGQSLFAAFGVRSLPAAAIEAVHLQLGAEVAQTNWDGANTWVDWARVESVSDINGVGQMQLSNGVMQGASGGGVFWNGVHIGNNWTCSHVQHKETGEVYNAFSAAALNSVAVLGDMAGVVVTGE